MLTNWVRAKPRYSWEWVCCPCKKRFSSEIPYRVRFVDEGHKYIWCEDCYQKLIK